MTVIGAGRVSTLIVERDALARTNLAKCVRLDCPNVSEAADADSALARLKQNPEIKLVLLDVDIASWRSVLSYATRVLPSAIVIAMGNLDSTVVIRNVYQLGAHEYLIKPLDPKLIRRIVSRLVP